MKSESNFLDIKCDDLFAWIRDNPGEVQEMKEGIDNGGPFADVGGTKEFIESVDKYYLFKIWLHLDDMVTKEGAINESLGICDNVYRATGIGIRNAFGSEWYECLESWSGYSGIPDMPVKGNERGKLWEGRNGEDRLSFCKHLIDWIDKKLVDDDV